MNIYSEYSIRTVKIIVPNLKILDMQYNKNRNDVIETSIDMSGIDDSYVRVRHMRGKKKNRYVEEVTFICRRTK